MPRDTRHSSRSRSRSPRRRLDTDSDAQRTGSVQADISKTSHHERSRPRSHERQSRSPTRKRHRRHDSRSRSRSMSRSKDKDRTKRTHSYSRSRSRERKSAKRRRDKSVSSSSESGEDTSHRRKEKRRDKDGKRSKSKERRKEKKREKKERREKKKKGKDSGSAPHWGKYGIITDIDIFTKSQEFHTWLVEERKVNPETITKEQQKKEFSRFVEDYNTATLPHEKYYNMEAYDRRMAALRQGEYLPPANDSYDFEADMKAVSGAHKKRLADNDTYMSKEQLMELRRVQQERSEVGRMKLLGMDVKQNFGVRMDGTMFDG